MEPLTESTLYVAATRPALLWGLPLELASLHIMAFGVLSVVEHNFLYGFTVVPFWFASGLLVRRDYNAVRVTWLWLRTTVAAMDSHLWGGSSVSPFPVQLPDRPRGIQSDAW